MLSPGSRELRGVLFCFLKVVGHGAVSALRRPLGLAMDLLHLKNQGGLPVNNKGSDDCWADLFLGRRGWNRDSGKLRGLGYCMYMASEKKQKRRENVE